jgi:hypothetical protein
MNEIQQSRAIPAVRSIASDSSNYGRADDPRSEFIETKALCVQLCYRALEQLSGFIVPEASPLDADFAINAEFKTTVSIMF